MGHHAITEALARWDRSQFWFQHLFRVCDQLLSAMLLFGYADSFVHQHRAHQRWPPSIRLHKYQAKLETVARMHVLPHLAFTTGNATPFSPNFSSAPFRPGWPCLGGLGAVKRN